MFSELGPQRGPYFLVLITRVMSSDLLPFSKIADDHSHDAKTTES